jgi:hypothetical protein
LSAIAESMELNESHGSDAEPDEDESTESGSEDGSTPQTMRPKGETAEERKVSL